MPNYPMPELEESTLFEKTRYYDDFEVASKGFKYYHCASCGNGYRDRGSARSCCGEERRLKKKRTEEYRRREEMKRKKFIEAMNDEN